MALDAQDKRDLIGMRLILGAPKVADLIVDMDKQYGDLPEMKAVNATFSKLAKGDTDKLKQLNTALEKDPGLAGRIKAGLGKDPEGFRTNFLPAVFKNPENASALLTQQAPKVQPKPPAPITKEYDYPEPAAVVAATKDATKAAANAPGKPKPASGQSATQPAAPAPAEHANEANARLAAKMDQLTATPGYDALMNRVNESPQLTDAVKAMMASNGTAAEREESVDLLLKKTKENPNLFKNIVKTLDTTPGAANTFAGMVANDPKNALNMMSNMGGDEGPLGALLGGVGGINGIKGIMNQLISGLTSMGLGGIGNFLGKLFQGLIGMVGGKFASAGDNHLVVASNVGTTQYNEAVVATKAQPASVSVIDGGGQLSTANPAAATAATQEKAKPVAAPAPLAQA
ncbi:MAG: hypothetical protein JWO78_605 [Micavibrio sp.]|nr:hypothetical protein [Micavibrio sp.]